MDINDRRAVEELLRQYEEAGRVVRVKRSGASFLLPDGREIRLQSEETIYETDGTRYSDKSNVYENADCGHFILLRENIGRTCNSCDNLLCSKCAQEFTCFSCGKPLCFNCARKGVGTQNWYCTDCLYLHILKAALNFVFAPLLFIFSALFLKKPEQRVIVMDENNHETQKLTETE